MIVQDASSPRLQVVNTPESAALTTFGARLKQLRVAAGLSQETLAERAGLSAHALSALERGARCTPRRATLVALMGALDLSAAEQSALQRTVQRERGPRDATDARTVAAAAPARLPMALSPLLGRDAEVSYARDLLLSGDVRLLTLTGPGGVGKTHLALAVSRAVEDDFPGGVSFVDLSPYDDYVAATTSIMAGLPPPPTAQPSQGHRFREGSGISAERRALMILDNCEHMLPTLAHEIAALLAARTDVTILATSRGALHLRCEYRLPIPTLVLPSQDDATSPEALLSVPSVALFVARARAVRPSFTLTVESGPVVADLCRRLDGLPLAIELAAASVDLFSPAALLDRLNRGLPLPALGGADAPARHQSLDASIDWSYRQLGLAGRALLRRLARLRGGWMLVHAMSIADAGPGDDILVEVLNLVDKGLAISDALGDEDRFFVLQTIRAYVTRLYATSDEAGELIQDGRQSPIAARASGTAWAAGA